MDLELHCPKCGERVSAEWFIEDLESSIQTNADLTVRLSEEIEKRNKLEAKLEEAKDAFIAISEYWNRSENDRAMTDALYAMIEIADKFLSQFDNSKPAEFINESDQEKLDEAMSPTIQELGEQAESEIDQTRRGEDV